MENVDCATVDRSPLRTERLTLRAGTTTIHIDVEVAAAGPERVQGLQCRSRVPVGTGMLFELPAEGLRGFWMLNTYVALDLLYFDHTGLAVAAATLRPCPRLTEESDTAWRTRCTAEASPHTPSDSYLFVLETPAGWLASQGLPPADAPHAVELVGR